MQLSYGKSENDLPTNKNNETINGKTDSLAGITFKTNHDCWNSEEKFKNLIHSIIITRKSVCPFYSWFSVSKGDVS